MIELDERGNPEISAFGYPLPHFKFAIPTYGLPGDEKAPIATGNVSLAVGFSQAITPVIVVVAVATIIQQAFDIQGENHGQERSPRRLRGYRRLCVLCGRYFPFVNSV